MVRGMARESAGIVRELQVTIAANTKAVLVNGKKETVPSYLGQLHAVVFNADELEIIRGLPDSRRRFLDAGIVSLHPPFVQVLTDYNRVLKQKSSLLQAARELGHNLDKVTDQLAPWNTQLAALAAKDPPRTPPVCRKGQRGPGKETIRSRRAVYQVRVLRLRARAT
jgi:DNA replication and repair protein RecF